MQLKIQLVISNKTLSQISLHFLSQVASDICLGNLVCLQKIPELSLPLHGHFHLQFHKVAYTGSPTAEVPEDY